VSTIEFDRAAVGVSAKADWTDSYTFGTIGSFIHDLSMRDVAVNLPAGDNSGVSDLRKKLTSFKRVMKWTAMEYSDACAVLGSGQEEAISNFDDSEHQTKQSFWDLVAERMGG
jgi:hypothetical protein